MAVLEIAFRGFFWTLSVQVYLAAWMCLEGYTSKVKTNESHQCENTNEGLVPLHTMMCRGCLESMPKQWVSARHSCHTLDTCYGGAKAGTHYYM